MFLGAFDGDAITLTKSTAAPSSFLTTPLIILRLKHCNTAQNTINSIIEACFIRVRIWLGANDLTPNQIICIILITPFSLVEPELQSGL